MIRQILRFYSVHGLRGFYEAVRHLGGVSRAGSFAPVSGRLAGRRGLEIGGPSGVFRRRGVFPVYPLLERLDNCNYAQKTVWGGECPEGAPFFYDASRPAGRQYVNDATDLRDVADGAYDVLLSSHVLEHLANPVRGLREWFRVLAPQGLLVLIVPDKTKTFDHRRPVTTFEHLVADFEKLCGEDDLTHVEEIASLHDLERDPGAKSYEQFVERARHNAENRCLHQHVFDEALVRRLLAYSQFDVISVESVFPNHVIAVACKRGEV